MIKRYTNRRKLTFGFRLEF